MMVLPLTCDFWVLPAGVGGVTGVSWSRQRGLVSTRTREDTVRQIVAGLTGDSDGTGDLAVELSKTDPASLETGQDSEDDSGEPEDWVPDPVDADPGQWRAALRGLGSLRGPVGLELWPPGCRCMFRA